MAKAAASALVFELIPKQRPSQPKQNQLLEWRRTELSIGMSLLFSRHRLICAIKPREELSRKTVISHCPFNANRKVRARIAVWRKHCANVINIVHVCPT